MDDLWDVSRITRGKVELKKERIEIAEVVAKAIELSSPLLEQRRHHLTVEVPSRGLFVDGDVTRLSQVVSNLLTNAAKYTEPGGRIEVEARRRGREVEIRVRDLYHAREVAERVRAAAGPSYQVRDWMQENENLLTVLTLQKAAYFVVLLLIVLVAGATIVATLIMVVMDKRKDIAVLKSMGAARAAIGRIFVWKGIIIGVVGTIAGNLGGLAGCWALKHYHFIELPKEVFYVSTVPVKMYPEYFAAVTVTSLAICFLATIYPARQASRLAPVDIIRYE